MTKKELFEMLKDIPDDTELEPSVDSESFRHGECEIFLTYKVKKVEKVISLGTYWDTFE